MSLEEKVMEGIKNAMRSRDEAALRALRAVKSAILIEKTSGSGSTLTEADEMKLLQKMVKQRKESMDIYLEKDRPDLAQKEKEELEVLEQFLPKQMTEEELREELKAIIAETGASSPADMGKVMGVASKKLAGRADGKMISEQVKQLLAQS